MRLGATRSASVCTKLGTDDVGTWYGSRSSMHNVFLPAQGCERCQRARVNGRKILWFAYRHRQIKKVVLKKKRESKRNDHGGPQRRGTRGASKIRQTHSSRFEEAQHALTNDQIPVSPLQLHLPALAHRRRCGRRGAVATANNRRAARVGLRGVLGLPDLIRGRHVRCAGRAEGIRVLVLVLVPVLVFVIGDDAESANVKLEVRLDVLEHDFPLEPHDRAGRVQLEQLVRAQAVPRKRAVVFEQLSRREGEHRIMVRG